MLYGRYTFLISCFITFLFSALYKEYADKTGSKNKKKQQFCKKIARLYNPTAAIIYVIVYWLIGLKNAQFY